MRKLMRVPMDFDYPIEQQWYTYLLNIDYCKAYSTDDDVNQKNCILCRETAKRMGVKNDKQTKCPDWYEYFKPVTEKLCELAAPPKGDGYQIWELTSEGSPISPVFETLDACCKWAAENLTVWAKRKATAEEWRKLLCGKKE